DQFRQGLIDLLMQRVEEVMRLEEARDAVVGVVVDENGAEQGLLGLQVVGRCAEGQGVRRSGAGGRSGRLAAGDGVHAPALGGFGNVAARSRRVFLILHRDGSTTAVPA